MCLAEFGVVQTFSSHRYLSLPHMVSWVRCGTWCIDSLPLPSSFICFSPDKHSLQSTVTGAEGVHLNLTLRQNYSVFMNEVNSRYHGPALAVDPKVDQEIFAWGRVGWASRS